MTCIPAYYITRDRQDQSITKYHKRMNALSITILSLCGIYMLLNFRHDIHMLQQNSYRPERYWRWMRSHGDWQSVWRLVDLAMILLLMASNLLPFQVASLLIAIVCVTKGFIILTRKYKKPLVFTARVKRIYGVTAVLSVGAVIAVAICTAGKMYAVIYHGFQIALLVILGISALSWMVVYAALFLLMPVERHINAGYRNEAISILRSKPDLKVVGVTGSYGKTSTKHYLQRILSEQFETLMTPGSYNTPMGVVRTVREKMKPFTEVFICEMGAKQKGDVKEICDIVRPTAGIITAVGPMHLETFKTIDNVQATKFELADAIPADGFVVVNNDFAACASRKVENTECIRYASSNPKDADYVATDIRYAADGTSFKVKGPGGSEMEFHTPLVGECNVSNLLAAIIVALKLGVPEEKIRYAVDRIAQVEHRLSVNRTPSGITVIDDAFNSNPAGAKMAVDVLAQFTEGKRIIVTPGMVELGEQEFDLNKALGRYIGQKVDMAVIVGEYNRVALVEGLKETSMPTANIHVVDSFEIAQSVLASVMKPGDTVLYENDLPDSFK